MEQSACNRPSSFILLRFRESVKTKTILLELKIYISYLLFINTYIIDF
ncbi:hypothetical protein JCM19294_249 [Nonlabens tegetincola]|uniref:Uncharacterized protein n=1 Tax=Nonlabens tegetincola TaxID=323273 RepID=A0A090Q7G0_9FLAO|nr:hypothetical protein JCM19294_249 [Nonlabens tegetincola]